MITFLTRFVFCLLTLPVWAFGQGSAFRGELPLESSWRVALSNYDLVYNLYLEESVWRLHIVELHPNELPRSRSQHVFSSRGSAMAFLERIAQGQSLRTQSLLAERSSVATEVASGVLWPVENQWSWEWEERYADWVRAQVSSDFFEKHNVSTDCADVAYSLRWIFARENRLPAANRLPGTGVMMTHETMHRDWARLKTHPNWWQDQRFRAALDYLMNFTYTHSLVRDAYPVAINPESFLPGAFHVELFGGTGHTQFVHRTNYTERGTLPFEVVASTVPRRVRRLAAGGFWNRQQNQEGRGGFLRFLWAERVAGRWSLRAPSAMPHFSREQYQPEFMTEKDNLALSIIKRLKPDYDPAVHITQGLSFLRGLLAERDAVVEEGYRVCSLKPCREGSADYEAWSTPSRDKRIGEMWNDLANYVGSIGSLEPRVLETWNKALREEHLDYQGSSHPLRSTLYQWRTGNYSSDPNESPQRRWGIDPEFIAERAFTSFRDLMAARVQKVASNKCRSSADCPLLSDSWKKNVSSTEDGGLQTWAYALYTLCDFHRNDVCDSAMDELKKREAEARGQKRSLWAWAMEVPWWIDDPRFSSNVRWGESTSRIKSMALPFGFNWFEVRENLLHGRGKKEGVLLKTEDHSWQLLRRDDFRWLGFHDQEFWGVGFDANGEYRIVNLKTGSSESLGSLGSSESGQIYWRGDRLGLVANQTLFVFEKVDGSWKAKNHWPLWFPKSYVEGSGLYLVRSNTPTIVDLRPPVMPLLSLKSNEVDFGPDMEFLDFVAETPSRHFMKWQRRSACQEPPCTVIGESTVAVEKRSGEASLTGLLVDQVARFGETNFALHRSIANPNHLQLVERDQELKVVSVIKEYSGLHLAGFESAQGNHHHFLLRGEGNNFMDLKAERLDIVQKRVETPRVGKDERLISMQGGRPYLWAQGTGVVLRDFDATENLVVGDSFWSLAQESDWHIMGRNEVGSWAFFHLPTSKELPLLTGRWLPLVGALFIGSEPHGPPPAPGWNIGEVVSFMQRSTAAQSRPLGRSRILKLAPGVQFLLSDE